MKRARRGLAMVIVMGTVVIVVAVLSVGVLGLVCGSASGFCGCGRDCAGAGGCASGWVFVGGCSLVINEPSGGL